MTRKDQTDRQISALENPSNSCAIVQNYDPNCLHNVTFHRASSWLNFSD